MEKEDEPHVPRPGQVEDGSCLGSCDETRLDFCTGAPQDDTETGLAKECSMGAAQRGFEMTPSWRCGICS